MKTAGTEDHTLSGRVGTLLSSFPPREPRPGACTGISPSSWLLRLHIFSKAGVHAKDVMSRYCHIPRSPTLTLDRHCQWILPSFPTDQDPARGASLEPRLSLGPSHSVNKTKPSCVRDGQGRQDTRKRLKTARQAEAHSTTRP